MPRPRALPLGRRAPSGSTHLVRRHRGDGGREHHLRDRLGRGAITTSRWSTSEGERGPRQRIDTGVAGFTELDGAARRARRRARPASRSRSRPTRTCWSSRCRRPGSIVYAINPRAVARYRERYGQAGKQVRPGRRYRSWPTCCAPTVTCTGRCPPISEHGLAVKALARQHQEAIWALQPDRQPAPVAAAGVLPASPGRVPEAHPQGRVGDPGRRADPGRGPQLTRARIVDAAAPHADAATTPPGRAILRDLHVPALRQSERGRGRARRSPSRTDRGHHRHADRVADLEAATGRRVRPAPRRRCCAPHQVWAPSSPRASCRDRRRPHPFRHRQGLRAFAGTAPVTRASGRSRYVKARRSATNASATPATGGPSPPSPIRRRPRTLRPSPRPRRPHNAALRNLANKLLGRLWWCLANDRPGTKRRLATRGASPRTRRRLTPDPRGMSTCADAGRVRLHRVRDRRVRRADRRLGMLGQQAHRVRRTRHRPGRSPAPPRRETPAKQGDQGDSADSSLGCRVARRIQPVVATPRSRRWMWDVQPVGWRRSSRGRRCCRRGGRRCGVVSTGRSSGIWSGRGSQARGPGSPRACRSRSGLGCSVTLAGCQTSARCRCRAGSCRSSSGRRSRCCVSRAPVSGRSRAQLGRAPSTISRELRRNASSRSGQIDYRAINAQWHCDRRARQAQGCQAGDERAVAPLCPGSVGRRDHPPGRLGCCGTRGRVEEAAARAAPGPQVVHLVESGADRRPAADRLPR